MTISFRRSACARTETAEQREQETCFDAAQWIERPQRATRLYVQPAFTLTVPADERIDARYHRNVFCGVSTLQYFLGTGRYSLNQL